jgi:hypothetical protein
MYDLDAANFTAEISIYTNEQSGRTNLPYNKIRWDFRYGTDDISQGIYMIWPYFLDENGIPISDGVPLVGTYEAKMYIVALEMCNYHYKRLSVGTEFFCHEGAAVMAKGVVQSINDPLLL